MRKKFVIIIFSLVGVYSAFILAISYLTDGFSMRKMSSTLSYCAEWETDRPSLKTLASMLKQNFYYIGHGSQCYVFESEDKQIVLKFFRLSRYRLPSITQYFTYPAFLADIQAQRAATKKQALDALFNSCKLGYEELREETGLIYLHLNKTSDLNITITLYDKLKRPYAINLDDYEFIVQKQGEQIFPYLTRLLKQDKRQEAKEAVESIVHLLITRLDKGIADHDPVVHKNSGFANNKAFFLDVGAFSKQQCLDRYQELRRTTAKIHAWLHLKDPQLAQYMESLLLSQARRVNRGHSPINQ